MNARIIIILFKIQHVKHAIIVAKIVLVKIKINVQNVILPCIDIYLDLLVYVILNIMMIHSNKHVYNVHKNVKNVKIARRIVLVVIVINTLIQDKSHLVKIVQLFVKHVNKSQLIV